MYHVAIMQKQTGFLQKIEDGIKTIESRWYIHRHTPFNKINIGDTVYFKNTGELITLSAQVEKVEQYENLSRQKIQQIVNNYSINLGLDSNQVQSFTDKIQNKKYGILIYLKNIQKVKSFRINKKGFGMQSAWITIEEQKFYTICEQN